MSEDPNQSTILPSTSTLNITDDLAINLNLNLNLIYMDVVIVKYNAGNIESVRNALLRQGIRAEISGDAARIRAADKVIFPGVGEATTTMRYLKAHGLDEVIRSLKQPVLGICLGLQLMCSFTEEGNTACLGIFDVAVKRFLPEPGREFLDKVPHMGWNVISELKGGILSPAMERQYFYFANSYYAEVGEQTSALCNYITPFSAALQRDNFYATQFHPEKSGVLGACVLKNFTDL